MVLISSRSAVLATFMSLAALSASSPLDASILPRDGSPSKSHKASHHKSMTPLSLPAKHKADGDGDGSPRKKHKGGKKKSRENKERSLLYDEVNPVSRIVDGAQAFFASRSTPHRRSPDHDHDHDHDHHHHYDHDHDHDHNHDHDHDHRRRSSVVVPGEKEGSYSVSRRQSEQGDREGSDAPGKIDVMTPDQKRVGSLFFDPERNTMLVSDSKSTTFFVHGMQSSDEGTLVQLKTNVVQNATEVQPCTTFGEDGGMYLDDCRADGNHQTFLYNKADSSVRPTIENSNSTSNSTSASSIDDVDQDQYNSQDTVTSFSIGARDPGASSTNVTLIFVPNDPVMVKSESTVTTSTITATYTSTVFVTSTDVAAVADVSSFDSSSSTVFAAVPTSSADTMYPADETDSFPPSSSSSADTSPTATGSTSTAEPTDSDSGSSPSDAQDVASNIANTPSSSSSFSSDAPSATDSTSSMAARGIRFRSTDPYNWRFKSSRA